MGTFHSIFFTFHGLIKLLDFYGLPTYLPTYLDTRSKQSNFCAQASELIKQRSHASSPSSSSYVKTHCKLIRLNPWRDSTLPTLPICVLIHVQLA
jgi:hypothetical protein